MATPPFTEFSKGDVRRYFVILLAIHRLKDRATSYRVAQEVACGRADFQRAVAALTAQHGVEFEREGAHYKITSWGVLQRKALEQFLNTP